MTGSEPIPVPVELSDDELRDVAREAGLSESDLREALAAQGSRQLGTQPRRRPRGGPHWPKSSSLRGRLALSPETATARVLRSIEGAVGVHGRHRGERGDVPVERRGLTYKICAERDGQGGSLVKVELDPSAGVANHVMLATIVTALSVTVMLLGGLFSSTVLALGAGIGLVGGLLVLRQTLRLCGALREATATAASALVEAELDAIGAPPGS